MTATPVQPQRVEFVRAISRLDATALVVGSMIGSGIFIVSADILRQVHSPGVLLFVWVLSGVVTLLGALSYGELAAMYPRAGGNYIYLREAISPLLGYLYGWTLFVVIQTGTIAAVAVAFARFTSVLWPGLSPDVLPGLATTHLRHRLHRATHLDQRARRQDGGIHPDHPDGDQDGVPRRPDSAGDHDRAKRRGDHRELGRELLGRRRPHAGRLTSRRCGHGRFVVLDGRVE